jgi:hypothetical protein
MIADTESNRVRVSHDQRTTPGDFTAFVGSRSSLGMDSAWRQIVRPGINNWDVSASKNFPLTTEKARDLPPCFCGAFLLDLQKVNDR